MSGELGSIGIASGWLPAVVDALAIALIVVSIARRSSARRVLVVAGAAVGGAALGLLVCWVCSDLLDLFEVSLSPVSRAWVATAFAAVAVAATQLARPGAGRRAASVAAIPFALLAGTLGVNADFGQYTTIGSLWDAAAAPPMPAAVAAAQRAGAPGPDVTGDGGTGGSAIGGDPTALWSQPAPAGMPRHGLVARVDIPGTVSRFSARAGYVYLPPAALVAHPRRLPVLVMMSGQPGGPDDVVQAGRLAAIMNARAARHRGLAPIVVVPDQLGAPDRNPMCVDSPLGDSATYLTVDVPNWIRTHLAVETAPAAWAVGGFSQGGTCAIQLGAAHPELFGAIFDVSGQAAPKNGSLQQTIARGFGGDAAQYRAAVPAAILATHGPYRGVTAVFGSGQFDPKYGPVADRMAAAARSAGMATTREVAPGTAHDWHTVQWMMAHAFGPIAARLGVERP